MWFEIEPGEIEYTQRSPFRIENAAIINAPPERVFEIVSTAENQAVWFPDFVACRWTSPAPHGVGATREIELKRLTFKERFLVWEPPKRLAFTVTAGTAPMLRRTVEEMLFERMGDRTLYRHVVHYEPSPLLRAVHPIVRAAFSKTFARATSGLAAYAAGRG